MEKHSCRTHFKIYGDFDSREISKKLELTKEMFEQGVDRVKLWRNKTNFITRRGDYWIFI